MANPKLIISILTEGGKKAVGAINSLEPAANKVGKALVGLGAVGAVGLGAIVKSAVSSFADYEQLVGGVDTLFKNSSKLVQGYADKAHKTAGMSANEYMETVTGFSASLLQSLGGDTDKAAKVADRAITDMADNANKMGTNIQDIQNAYQGFAKQNYTMLDNLKLGYGGTKSEMERLLADAEKINGVKYDISSLNDVYEAIHVVQTELDITGTTALEAASTISGSFNATKASLSNLMTALATGQGIDGAIEALFDNVGNLTKNLGPVVAQIFSSLTKIISENMPQIAEGIKKLLISVLGSGLGGTLGDIIGVILNNLGVIKNVGIALTGMVISIKAVAIAYKAWQFISGMITGIKAVMTAVTSATNTSKVATIAYAVAAKALAAGQKIAAAAQWALNAAMNANPLGLIVIAIIAVIAILVTLYNKFEGFRDIVNAVIAYFKSLYTYWSTVFNEMLKVVATTVNAIKGRFNNLGTTIRNIVNGFKNIFSNVKNFIITPFKTAIDWVVDKWRWLVGQIKSFTVNIGTSIGNAISNVVNGVKSFINEFFIGKVNGFISAINGVKNKIPVIGGSLPNIPSVPYLAKGGIVDQATLAVVGEAGSEAVIPLRDSVLSKISDGIVKAGGNHTGDGVVTNIQQLIIQTQELDEVEFIKILKKLVKGG